jgi:anti-sigma B factor antagonist
MASVQTATGRTGVRQSIIVIKVGGYLDFTTSDEIDKVIDRCVRGSSHRIIVDLGDVDYISSRGWSIFLSRLKEIRDSGGDLKLACMKPDVFQVYEVLEFFWFLKSYESLEQAVNEFDKGVPPMPE